MPLLVQRNAGAVRFDSCERKMLDSASIRESRTLVCGDKHHYTLPLAASGVQMAARKRDLWKGAKTLVTVSRARKTAVVGGPRSGCG